MSEFVFMFRSSRDPRGRDLFSCSSGDWHFLQELGITFGWRPQGATYRIPMGSKIATSPVRNYEPGDASDRKDVGHDDAVEWGRALERAKRSVHLSAMLEARIAAMPAGSTATAESLIGLIDEFAAYAYGGAFGFARSDRARR